MKTMIFCLIFCSLSACGPKREISPEEASALRAEAQNTFLSQMVLRPGGDEKKIGTHGGIWNTAMDSDPTTFNLTRINDLPTTTVMSYLCPYLLEYDIYKKEWSGNLADFRVAVNEKKKITEVHFTLRTGLSWFIPKTGETVPFTADDAVFWIEEIIKDPGLNMAEYSGMFVTMPDGSREEIKAVKTGDSSFKLVFPRIVADPLLASNMQIGPRFLYEAAKKRGGSREVVDFITINTDPLTIPTAGPFYIERYTPGLILVLKRNPHYFLEDAVGQQLPYLEAIRFQFVSNPSTQLLLFQNGELETLSVMPHDLDRILSGRFKGGYEVINGGPAPTAAFITWNRNPDRSALPEKYYSWFSKKEFRQAMSCLLDRGKIIANVYRGLAKPVTHFFNEASPVYEESIVFEYFYNPEKALALLDSIGIRRDSAGIMRDSSGNAIRFDFWITADNPQLTDIANIYADDLKKQGITMTIRVVDFAKMVDSLLYTFDWQSLSIALSGSNLFPSQGSNVWPSGGNLHMWYPNQKTPATEWEAEIDRLYTEASYTADAEKAKALWDRYQSLIWEQVPLVYLVRPYAFLAVRNKWENVTFDALDSFDIRYVFEKKE